MRNFFCYHNVLKGPLLWMYLHVIIAMIVLKLAALKTYEGKIMKHLKKKNKKYDFDAGFETLWEKGDIAQCSQKASASESTN